MEAQLNEQILKALGRRGHHAAFVTEVAASLRPRPDTTQIEDALADLHRNGLVLITDHPAPDVHLASMDLRIVAEIRVEDSEANATVATEQLWDEWLRAFFSTHRCQ